MCSTSSARHRIDDWPLLGCDAEPQVCDRAQVARLRCEIFPADLDATVAFYTRVLGFELERDERAAPAPYVALRLGDVRLGAARRAVTVDPTGRRPPTGVELVLESDDLDGARARVLGCGWPIETDLADQPWGLRDFRLLDPSGYYWRITEPS